ncbi:hypothetical protein RYH80_16500 [Halobaculum sp. MBLA0147]|uniref:hypothetical protein n=1 Tax=Halobaculum sp. MBLA0147 TaxID=3079934 RepID=UPI003524F425
MRPKAPADPKTSWSHERDRTVSGRSVLLIAAVAVAFLATLLVVSYVVPLLGALA